MLDKKYLRYGLDALSRAHRMNYFLDRHRGAAIVAAYFFCQEVKVEKGVEDIVQTLIDKQWVNTPLCDPFPREPFDATGTSRILEVLGENVDGLRQVGHNVIFPTKALKAFSEVPELLTPSRVEGICRLIEAFAASDQLSLDEDDVVVDFSFMPETAEFILSELLLTMRAFDGRGQGWSGHLLTYARALLDLRQLDYVEMSKKAEPAFSLYIKRIRMGPLDTDKSRREHSLIDFYPHQCEYWENRKDLPLNLGHSIKYPYGFYGIVEMTKNHELINKCFDNIYHIF
jgi:hypothetical protein